MNTEINIKPAAIILFIWASLELFGIIYTPFYNYWGSIIPSNLVAIIVLLFLAGFEYKHNFIHLFKREESK